MDTTYFTSYSKSLRQYRFLGLYDIRRGAFQGVARLTTAEVFGHADSTKGRNITSEYVGVVADPALVPKRLRAENDSTF